MERPAPEPAWSFAFLRKKGKKQWNELKAQLGDEACEKIRATLTSFPGQRTERNKQLRGKDLRTKVLGGRELPRWEYESSGGGRIRYLIDFEQQRIIVEQIHFGHPKDTE